MSFVAVAIGGSALLGAGASIYGASEQAGAAEAGAGAQQAGLASANRTTVQGGMDALSYLDPFRQAGLRAGGVIEAQLYSPEQQQQQIADQRRALQAEVNRLTTRLPKFEQYSGNDPAFSADWRIAEAQLNDAKAKLAAFNQQAKVQVARAAQPAPTIEASPWYTFQAELLGRNMDRAFAARGLTGSGFEAEERRRGLIELGAGETERQFGRLKGLYDVGANAAAQGAGAITGTSQAIAGNQVASGQAQAQGMVGVAGANANLVSGVANSVTGGVGAGLNYLQFQNLINANKPMAPNTTTPWRATNTDLNAYG